MELIYYVYAVTRSGAAVQHPELGILENQEIISVENVGLRALVSLVPAHKFTREALEHSMTDLGWLERMVRAHTGIVTAIESESGVVPMRFCTVCRSLQKVSDFLASNKTVLLDILDQVKGAHEWGIKVYCDTKKLGSSLLMPENPGERSKPDKHATTGTSFLLRKKKMLEQRKSMADIRGQCTSDCHNRLDVHAISSLVTALQDKELTGRSEEMIFNGAYLVNQAKAKDFHSTVARLTRQYTDLGFDIVQSGPWPPYHFIEALNE